MTRRRNAAAVAGAALAVTVVWLAPLAFNLDGAVLGGPSDLTSTARDYSAAENQGRSPLTFEQDPTLNAPEGLQFSPALAVSTGIQTAFVWLAKDAVGFVAALNLYLLLGFVLASVTMFALLQRLRLHPLACAFGAYVWAFNPFVFEKAYAGHAGLVQVWVFPLLVLAILRARERRTVARSVVAGVVVAVAFYIHAYFGFLALLIAAVFVAVEVVQRTEARAVLRSAGVALGTALALLVPTLVAYRLDRTGISTVTDHPIDALQQFGARVTAYLVPAEGHPLLGGLVGDSTRRRLADSGEPALFFGYSTMLLAAVAIVLLGRRVGPLASGERRYAAIAFAVLAPVAFLVSLPRTFGVLGIDVPMPSYLFGELSTAVRVYARFGVLVGLGLTVLAAFALHWAIGQRRGRLLGVAALALVAAELVYDVPVTTWRADRPPAYDTWLASQPRGIVAFYPSPGSDGATYRYARQEYFFQTVHRQPLFFSGSPRKDRAWAIRVLASRVDDESELAAGILAAEGVRYVVVNDAVYEAAGDVPPLLSGETFAPLAHVGDARIFTVRAEPARLDESLAREAARVAAALGIPKPETSVPGQGFNELERAADGSQSHWMIQDGFVEVDNRDSNATLELAAEGFSARTPRRLDLIAADGSVLASTEVSTSSQQIRIGPFRLPTGEHTLRLRADPGPEPLGNGDPRLASVFLSPIDVRPVADYSRR